MHCNSKNMYILFGVVGFLFASCLSEQNTQDIITSASDRFKDISGPEKCDGYDNDKDGYTDEDFDGDGDGFPHCRIGSRQSDCDDGNHLIHSAASEICNDNIDNDCDGKKDALDEDCDVSCGVSSFICELTHGICANVGAKCINGQALCDYGSNPLYQPVELSCNDQKDNDCDGLSDQQDSDCTQFGACSAGGLAPECKRPGTAKAEGLCSGRLTECVNGYWSCNFANIAGFEAEESSVDTADNDCDGQVDEGEKTFGGGGGCESTDCQNQAQCTGSGGQIIYEREEICITSKIYVCTSQGNFVLSSRLSNCTCVLQSTTDLMNFTKECLECGHLNENCCSSDGSQCYSGLTCRISFDGSQYTCQQADCGHENEACCDTGEKCFAGLSCLLDISGSQYQCQQPTAASCGHNGEFCCTSGGSQCYTGFKCDALGVCRPDNNSAALGAICPEGYHANCQTGKCTKWCDGQFHCDNDWTGGNNSVPPNEGSCPSNNTSSGSNDNSSGGGTNNPPADNGGNTQPSGTQCVSDTGNAPTNASSCGVNSGWFCDAGGQWQSVSTSECCGNHNQAKGSGCGGSSTGSGNTSGGSGSCKPQDSGNGCTDAVKGKCSKEIGTGPAGTMCYCNCAGGCWWENRTDVCS